MPQRGCVPQPKVAPRALPWVQSCDTRPTRNGLRPDCVSGELSRDRDRHNRVAVGGPNVFLPKVVPEAQPWAKGRSLGANKNPKS